MDEDDYGKQFYLFVIVIQEIKSNITSELLKVQGCINLNVAP